MIKKRTVLVIGAGTSAAYGFPLGSELVTQATELLAVGNRGSEVFRTLLDAGCDKTEAVEFGDELRRTRPPSIDVFLRRRPSYNALGKKVIAALLIPRETSERRLSTPDDDWLPYFFERILGHSKDDIRRNNLTVVSFNFDRLFEWALFNALQGAYGLGVDETVRLASYVPTIHVYGSLGQPAWLTPDHREARAYDPKLTPEAITSCAESVGIVGDDVEPTCCRTVQEAFRNCVQVCFLGFGYHEMNLSWLRENGLSQQETFGTALGMQAGERFLAQAMLPGIKLGHEDYCTRFYLRWSPLLHEPLN